MLNNYFTNGWLISLMTNIIVLIFGIIIGGCIMIEQIKGDCEASKKIMLQHTSYSCLKE